VCTALLADNLTIYEEREQFGDLDVDGRIIDIFKEIGCGLDSSASRWSSVWLL
jgi:hypothetical protein